MKLSFVIPVYKTERYLARCLDSLVAQTDGDFEAIVVDDASPGEAGRSGIAPYPAGTHSGRSGIAPYQVETNPAGSSSPPYQAAVGADPRAARYPAQEIVARYDSRFRFVRQDRNRSTFQAKATGAKLATGDYIVPLDSDDYVLPRLVEELKRAVRSGDAAAAQSNDPTIQQSDDPPLRLHLFPQPDVLVYQMAKEFRGKVCPVKYNHPAGHCTGAEALEKLFAGRIFMPVCGKAIRREVFLAAYEGLGVGPDFYLNFTDDICWLIPILLNAGTVTFVGYSGYRYWRHDDSMTTDVMAPEKVRLLAEQSRRSLAAVIAYAERLGAAAREARAGRESPGAAAREARAGRESPGAAAREARAGRECPGAAAREARAGRDGRCAPASGAPRVDNRLIAEIRAQIYPTIRWLMRDMGQPRALLEEVYGADLVSETLRWDAASGGKAAKLLRHIRTYGLPATVREVVAQLRHVEI